MKGEVHQTKEIIQNSQPKADQPLAETFNINNSQLLPSTSRLQPLTAISSFEVNYKFTHLGDTTDQKEKLLLHMKKTIPFYKGISRW